MRTIPCFAARSDLYPGIVYAAEPVGPIGNSKPVIVWLSEPTMDETMAQSYRWATDEQMIDGPYVNLTAYAMAELLFVDGRNPLTLDDAAAVEAISRALDAVNGSMIRCSMQVSDALTRHSADAEPRWHLCIERARQLAAVA